MNNSAKVDAVSEPTHELYQPLFDLMDREHGVILLLSEMREILDVCASINAEEDLSMTQKITDVARTHDFQDGYRQAMQEAISICQKYGYALDHGGNQYVYSNDALVCSKLLQKSLDSAQLDVPAVPTTTDREVEA